MSTKRITIQDTVPEIQILFLKDVFIKYDAAVNLV